MFRTLPIIFGFLKCHTALRTGYFFVFRWKRGEGRILCWWAHLKELVFVMGTLNLLRIYGSHHMIPVFNTCTTLSARNCHTCINSGKHMLFLCDSLQAFPHMADKTTYLLTLIIFALFFKHAWWLIFWTKIFFLAQYSNFIPHFL